MANGEEISTPVTSEGAYLVKLQDPDAFEVEEGVFASKGSTLPSSVSSLPPGKHAKAERIESPREVFVRVKGTGLLRGIELTESVPLGPDGLEVARTRDIQIPDGVAEQRPEQVLSHHHR